MTIRFLMVNKHGTVDVDHSFLSNITITSPFPITIAITITIILS